MAEQIRSFWSHLCGIFGAILGVVIGGTLVSIERAEALGAGDCDDESQFTRDVYDGAVVYSCHGGGYGHCAKVDEPSRYSSCKSSPCYKLVSTNYPRYYTYFVGCADGYYSVEGYGIAANKRYWYGTLLTATTSSGQIPGCQTVPVLNGDAKCIYCDGTTYSTSAGKVTNGPYRAEGYDVYPWDAVAGKCEKCPAYDEVYNDYTASTLDTTSTVYAKAISSCFMSANTERNDAIEHDGNATGNFVWTQSCMYSGSEPEPNPWADCEAMNGSGNCTITLDDAGAQKMKVIPVVRSVTGLGLKEAKAIVASAPTTIIEDFSCEAAECYKEIFDANNADVTITEY